MRSLVLVGLLALLLGNVSPASATPAVAPAGVLSPAPTIRFAQFNASVNRNSAGQLLGDLATPDNAQLRTVAEIIQRTAPDVLLINEFDYYPDNAAADLFQQNYLGVSQNGAPTIAYPYVYVAPSNTGVPSGYDLDNNGSVGGPNDALGFGFFPGQFGMAVFSKYPIRTRDLRTFQTFLWKDMPGARLPDDPATPAPADWYSPEELNIFRLSSKSHWDVPIEVAGSIIHALVSHPTPPVFDGPEDRNGTRNADEIRFWADYITPGKAGYIYDDRGRRGGLRPGASFVIMGDQNSDPLDGDSIAGAIQQILDLPNVNTSVTPTSPGGPEQSALQGGANLTHASDPRYDTADFADGAPGNLRADYVLPSTDLRIRAASVFWPASTDPLFRLVGTFNPTLPGGFPSSDHRAVLVDLQPVPTVQAREETRPVLDLDPADAPQGVRLGDADDIAIWVNRANLGASTIVGVLKDGGLDVYNLEGRTIQSIAPAEGEELRYNNVDIAYDINLGDARVDLVVATDRRNDLLCFFAVDAARGTLERRGCTAERIFTAGDDAALDAQTTAYGLALYKSVGGLLYAFVSQRENNIVAQFAIESDAAGGLAARELRRMALPLVDDDPAESQVEGMVVDQELGLLYAAQEGRGIWKFDAAPGGATTGELIDAVAPEGGNLVADAEGLTIYYGRGGAGYLLASSQGDSTFAVYGRQSNAYLGSFRVGGTRQIDGVQQSDGAEVLNVNLGPGYPSGILVVHDGLNDPAVLAEDDGELENVSTNFKFVRWERVAGAFAEPLLIDTAGYAPGRVTPLRDSFGKRDGVALGAPWTGEGRGGYRHAGGALQAGDGGPVYWAARFGDDQEAYMTYLGGDTPALLLKVQASGGAPNWRSGAIRVSFGAGVAEVETYQPGAEWQTVATLSGDINAGDRLIARALADGSVQVLVNGVLLGSADTTATSDGFFVGRSGRIGLWLDAGGAVDDFGGGTVR